MDELVHLHPEELEECAPLRIENKEVKLAQQFESTVVWGGIKNLILLGLQPCSTLSLEDIYDTLNKKMWSYRDRLSIEIQPLCTTQEI